MTAFLFYNMIESNKTIAFDVNGQFTKLRV